MPNLHSLFGLSQEQAHQSLWFVSLETFILLCIFLVLTELAGRKTIAQMTMLQMIVTIGIGEALLMPVVDKEFSIIKTIVIVSVMIGFVIVNEWLEVKFNWYERIFTPKAEIIIKDGELQTEKLKKLRLTVDQVEMYLRSYGIESINYIKTATLEANGTFGFQLKPEEQPLTVKDMQDFQNKKTPQTHVEGDIFKEIKNPKIKHKKKLR